LKRATRWLGVPGCNGSTGDSGFLCSGSTQAGLRFPDTWRQAIRRGAALAISPANLVA